MKRLFKSYYPCFAALFYFISGSGQSYVPVYAEIADQCSETRIIQNLTEFENLGVKSKGTAAQANTLTWLKNKYLSYGYTLSQITTDSFSYGGSTSVNLIVTKTGTVYPNTFVIIDGHYDTIYGPGTNDNGSGVAVILEIAKLLQNVSTEYSIKFINFSGEEDGLLGSQHYVSTVVNGTVPKMNIRLVFNIDEVGGVAGANNNTIMCERDTDNNPSTNNAASNTMTTQLMACVNLYSSLTPGLSYAYSSDYVPFENNGEIITGFFEGNESTHPHSSSDRLINMDPAYVHQVARAATGAALHFAKATQTTLGLTTNEKDYGVSFYPVPAHNRLTIHRGDLGGVAYRFTLTDLSGKIVLDTQIQHPGTEETITLGHLASGVYSAAVIAGEASVIKKIIIE